MAKLAKLDVYTHHVAISEFDRSFLSSLRSFIQPYIEYDTITRFTGEVIKEAACVYASRLSDNTSWRIHVNLLPKLLSFLSHQGIPQSALEITYEDLYDATKVDYILRDDLVPREYQEPQIEYIVSPGYQKVLTMTMGDGKTVTTCFALRILGVRCALVIPPKYVERWVGDLTSEEGIMNLNPDEMMIIQGSVNLMQAIAMGLSGELTAKFIIISSKTLQLWFKHYELTNGDTNRYGIHPYELFETLGVGVRAVDEVHEQFHFNYHLDLYTHVPLTISLSGTLEHGNSVRASMFMVMFPMNIRIPNRAHDKFTEAINLTYQMDHPRNIKFTQRGLSSYNHIAFENNIMKQPNRLDNYLKMIAGVVVEKYGKDSKEGQKAIVYASTIEMCEKITAKLATTLTHKQVAKYTGGDNYQTLLDSDVAVATPGAAGTAVDIPGLRDVFATTAIGSIQQNLQMFGRLRKPKDYPATQTRFYYFTCTDIPQHVRYHYKKEEQFETRAKSFSSIALPYKL